jgi:hypothetical protein
MHLDALLNRLKAMYGAPIPLEDQAAYRWEVRTPDKDTPIHVCMTWEDVTRRCSIWVFDANDPDNPMDYLDVNEEAKLDAVLAILRERVPPLDFVLR